MPVEIDFEHPGTGVEEEGVHGFLILHDPEKEVSYASWPFHINPSEHYMADSGHVWEWKNPGQPIEDITLSPSLLLEWDEPNTFHIHIRDGEVQHCADCQCGCQGGEDA